MDAVPVPGKRAASAERMIGMWNKAEREVIIGDWMERKYDRIRGLCMLWLCLLLDVGYSIRTCYLHSSAYLYSHLDRCTRKRRSSKLIDILLHPISRFSS
jgi:hypothetical protein